MALGDRIKALREKRDWSQTLLAKKMGISKSVMSRIESGARPLEDSLLIKVSEVLEVSSDYLLGITDDKRHPAVKLREYLDMGLTDEEIKKRMEFVVDIFKLNDSEINEFISFLRWRLAEKKQPTVSASKHQEP